MIFLEIAYYTAEPITFIVLGIISAVVGIGTSIYETERNRQEGGPITAVAVYDLPEKENQNLIIFVLFLLLIFGVVFFYFLNKGKNG